MALDFFSPTDQEFIKSMELQIPGLIDNFTRASLIQPINRFDWGNQELQTVFRDGWFVNTPVGQNGDAESVSAHIIHLANLIEQFFPTEQREDALGFNAVHDNQESIAHAVINGIRRDLNPKFNTASYSIIGDDKKRIESLAVEFLFFENPELKAIWDEYNSKRSNASQSFGAIDNLCVMWKCTEYVESGKYSYPDFQRYWDYWPLDKVREKMPSFISEAFADLLQPRINAIK